MRRTQNFILINKKTKKINKKTIIGWKTFNPKKINLILPKLKKIINIINNVISRIMIAKQKEIIKQIIHNVKQEKMYLLISKNKLIQNGIKNNVYSSFFTNHIIQKNTIINLELGKKENNITDLFHKYVYITNIINNLQNVTVNELILPPQRTTYTVLRSPHADKKAREQFAKGLYNTKMIINQYTSIMRYLNQIVYFYTKSFISSYKYKTIY